MSQSVNYRAQAQKAATEERKTAAETDKLLAETLKLNAEAHKLDAEALKLNAEQDKLLAERRKAYIETFRSTLTLCAILASALGFAAIFLYCFSYIHYFPTGLTLTDTAFFLFIVLALGVYGVGISLVGYLLYTPWVFAEQRVDAANAASQNSGAQSTRSKHLRDPFLLIITAILSLTLAILSLRAGIIDYVAWNDIEAAPSALGQIWNWATTSGVPLLFAGCALVIGSVLTTIRYWHVRSVHTFAMYWSFVPQFLLAALGLLLLINVSESGTALCLVLAPAIGGFMLALAGQSLPDALNSENPESSRKRSLKVFALTTALAICIPLFYLSNALPGGISILMMRTLGVYSDDPGLLVNADNLAKLRAVADSEGAFLYSCQEADDTTLVSNVRVWWHGVGTGTYVEVLPTGPAQWAAPNATGPDTRAGSAQSDNSNSTERRAHAQTGRSPAIRGALVELESKGVQIVRGRVGKCVEIPNSLVFASNRVNITGDQKTAAEIALAALKNKAQQGDGFLFTGHADYMPAPRLSNYDLSLQRACGVYRLFTKKNPLVAQDHMWVDAQGALRPVKNCDGVKDIAEKRECMTSNRRVTVRVIPSFDGLTDNGWLPAEPTCRTIPLESESIQKNQKIIAQAKN